MHWRLLTLLSGCACVIVGCSLITSLDDLRSTNGSDASTGDGSVGADAGGNFVTNPSFENGAGGCGANWGNGYGATFTRESPGHSGQYACDVCVQGSGTSYELDDIADIPVQAGSYYAEAWLATDDGGIATQAGIQVRFTGDGGMSGCGGSDPTYCQGSIFTPTSTWAASSTTFAVTGSGTIKLDVHSYAGAAGSCVAVDDVALYLQ